MTDTAGRSTAEVVRRLAGSGVKLNVTAILTLAQVREVAPALAGGPSAIVSVFAGRIADTGRDPVPDMAAAVEILRPWPALQLLWASPREILNVVQADQVGCHIITAPADVLKKLPAIGTKTASELSLAAVNDTKTKDDETKTMGILSVRELRLMARDPILDLAVFADRNFATGATFIALIGLGMFSSMLLLAVFTQKLLGYDAWTSGLVLAPGGFGNMLCFELAGGREAPCTVHRWR